MEDGVFNGPTTRAFLALEGHLRVLGEKCGHGMWGYVAFPREDGPGYDFICSRCDPDGYEAGWKRKAWVDPERAKLAAGLEAKMASAANAMRDRIVADMIAATQPEGDPT